MGSIPFGTEFDRIGPLALTTAAAQDMTQPGEGERQILSVASSGLDGCASALHAKNDVHDALNVIEPLRVQVVGHLDVLMVHPGDLEGEACGREPYEPQPEVAGIGIVIVGSMLAHCRPFIVLKTAELNDK